MQSSLREERMASSSCTTCEPPATPSTPTTHRHHHHHHLPSSPTVASSPPLTAQPPASTLTSLCNMSTEASAALPTSECGGIYASSTYSSNTLPSHQQQATLLPHEKQTTATAFLPPDKQQHSALAADKQAALSSKLRLAKNLATTNTGLASPSSFHSFRASLMDDHSASAAGPGGAGVGGVGGVSYNHAYGSLIGSSRTPSTINSPFGLHTSDMDITSVGIGIGVRNSGANPDSVIVGDSDIHVMSPSLVNSQVLSKTRPLSPFPGEVGSSADTKMRSGSPRHMSQHIYQTHEYQRNHRHDASGIVRGHADVRETLDGNCGSAMLPPVSPKLDAHPGHQFVAPHTERAPSMDRKSCQRNSWSRRCPGFLEDKESLKGSVRELLDSNESMASLKSSDGGTDTGGPPTPAEEAKTGSKGKGGRGRRRPRLFKLKFHHQALPAEYLDHYEASLRQEQKLPPPPPPAPSEPPPQPRGKGRGSRAGAKTPRPITIHEAGNGATEALLRELLLSRPHLQQAALQQAALARAQSVPSIMMASKHGAYRSTLGSATPSPVPSIPEEGDNETSEGKTKKGRKNRKDTFSMVGNGLIRDQSPGLMARGDITSTLEGQYAAMEHEAMSRSRSYTSLIRAALTDQNEPLNLCVRDTPLKIEDNCISHVVKEEPPNTYSDIIRPPSVNIRSPDVIMRRSSESRTPMSPPIESGPWASTLAHHPQWMHDYRLKTEDGFSSGQSTPSLCSQSSHLPPISPPAWPHFSPPQLGSPHPHSPSPLPMTPPHRNVHALLKESLHLRLEEAARERLTPHDAYMASPDRMSTNTPIPPHHPNTVRSPARGGARKKRSAVHIPTPNPNTEVSICKFKFTGGPNPMLEEKKMVSVDSSGTMRYFSRGERGVGFEHGSAQSQHRLSGRVIGNISKSEKDNKKIRLESQLINDDSLMSQSSSSIGASPSSLEHSTDTRQQLNQVEDSPKRKRRSKKASVRERFEQTLREKGLLIQTQQVESAEGATYCKFRQLRKITRYLFRNWKDHLPGQLPEDGQVSE